MKCLRNYCKWGGGGYNRFIRVSLQEPEKDEEDEERCGR